MGRTTKRPPPGRTMNGVKKTRALKKKIRAAAEVIQGNLEGRKAGRPPEFHDGFCHLAEQTAIINATDMNLCELFGASPSAIEDWLAAYPRFVRAIQRGKEFADNQVEAALAHRARGYSHPSEKIFLTRAGRIVRAKYTEHYPPDTAAAFIWLKNRRSGKWKDRQPEGGDEGDAPPPVKIEIAFKDAKRVDVKVSNGIDDLLKGA